MNKILRPCAALVLLLALVIGVPLSLLALAGWPTPTKVPDVGNMVTMARQNNVQSDFIVKSIALVVWIAWLQLMAAVIWEMVVNVPRLLNGRRQRRAPLVVSPVANGVAKLFSMILTAGLLSTAVSPPAAALTNTEVTLPANTSSTSPEQAGIALPVVTTGVPISEAKVASLWIAQGNDSLWDIAEQALGDGSEVSRILQMNPDLDVSQTLQNGTAIRLPSGSRVPSTRVNAPSENSGPRGTGTTSIASEGAPDTKQYTVQANDGMWNVADALLGDGLRHVELHALVVGQEVAPGVVFTADTFVIHEGWVFTVGADAAVLDADALTGSSAETYTVAAGDTLSGIAQQQLGDVDDWTEIFAENAGRQMESGRTFDDPDLILPGWQIEIPVDDSDATEADTPTPAEKPRAADETSGPSASEDVPPPIPRSTSEPADVGTRGTDTPGAPEDDSPVEPSTMTTSMTSTTVPAPVGDSAGSGIAQGVPESPTAPSPVRIEHAALLAAGVLALVGVRRRQRLRAAEPRARVPEPPPSIVATERRLRTIDAGERSLRVDVAIRAAASELVNTDTQIGTVLVDHDGGIEIRLTAPTDLRSPWVPVGDDRQSWNLPASLPIELLGELARRVGTPCVALVQLGISKDRDVLVDVEACGTLAIDAQAGQATEVLTALAAGLATSPYAEIAHLVTVALADAAIVGHRNAHRALSSGEAFELAASLIGTTSSAERSTFSLRCLRTGGEMWEPTVILLDDLQNQLSDLPIQLPSPGRGIGLVAATPSSGLPESAALLVGSSTGWRFDAFGTTIQLTPVGIDKAELAALSELIDDASAPLSIADELTWATSGSESGQAILDDELRNEDAGHSGATPTGDARADVSQPIKAFDCFEPDDHQIIVRLMGGVEVVSRDDRPGVFERSKTVELIAWLATHRSSSTRAAARTALWELDVRDATFANVVSEARRALARLAPPPRDDEWVARTLTEQLPLHSGVVTDADLIEARLAAARLQPPAQAIETLTPAAAMIREVPFAGTSYLWTDAEGITSNLVLLATGVATELAGHALSLGDTDLVFWATGQGLKVLPGYEELIGLRMQAHARAGDLAGVRQEWESYERVIVADAWSDGEPAPKLLALRHELLTSPA